MIDPNQDRELQAKLLNHPAIHRPGVDPLWRWIALTLGAVVVVLVCAIAARGGELRGNGISGSNAAAVNGSLGARISSGATANKETTREPAGPGTDLITERFLDALEEVESGKDARAVGDQGRSLGSYQFKAVAWAQVNTLRDARGLGRHSYRFGAHNRVTARIYAREYLGWLQSYLTRALHRSPTHQELYAVWNLGPAGFRARGFKVGKCPEHVRSAGQKVKALTTDKH